MESKRSTCLTVALPWCLVAAISLTWLAISIGNSITEMYTVAPSTGLMLPLQKQVQSLKMSFEPGRYRAEIVISCDAPSLQGNVDGTFTLRITGPSGEVLMNYENEPLHYGFFDLRCPEAGGRPIASDRDLVFNGPSKHVAGSSLEIPDRFGYITIEASIEFPEGSHVPEGAASLVVYGELEA